MLFNPNLHESCPQNLLFPLLNTKNVDCGEIQLESRRERDFSWDVIENAHSAVHSRTIRQNPRSSIYYKESGLWDEMNTGKFLLIYYIFNFSILIFVPIYSFTSRLAHGVDSMTAAKTNRHDKFKQTVILCFTVVH